MLTIMWVFQTFVTVSLNNLSKLVYVYVIQEAQEEVVIFSVVVCIQIFAEIFKVIGGVNVKSVFPCNKDYKFYNIDYKN